jgi:hypothetical protein
MTQNGMLNMSVKEHKVKETIRNALIPPYSQTLEWL